VACFRHRFVWHARQRQERHLLNLFEERERSLACRAVYALPGCLEKPLGGLGVGHRDRVGVGRGQEVAPDVFHAGLNPALLFWAPNGRGIDFAAVVARQLAVGAVERQLVTVTGAERGAHDSGLEVIRHEGSGRTTEEAEGLRVQRHPGRRLLIVDDPGEHVPAVGQHHDEDPGLAHQARSRVEEPPCESEVELCDIARLSLDRVDDVLGPHATLAGDAPGGTLDRLDAAGERGVLSVQTVPDGLGTDAALKIRPDGGQPGVDGGGDLAGCGWWPLGLDGYEQDAEFQQLGGVACEQTSRIERPPVALLGAGAHSELSRPLSTTCSRTVKPNQLL